MLIYTVKVEYLYIELGLKQNCKVEHDSWFCKVNSGLPLIGIINFDFRLKFSTFTFSLLLP